VTIWKTIDTLIATYRIENGISLLFSDRDFVPFVEHLAFDQPHWAVDGIDDYVCIRRDPTRTSSS
jgi:hypothetical protein